MKKFAGMLLCTDLDGTLLDKNQNVSKENLEAIEYFQAEGGYFTFVTGRMPYFVEKIYRTVRPNAPIGCINGGGIYDYEKNRYLHATTLPDSVIELVEYIDQNVPNVGIQLNALEHLYFSRENKAMKDFRSWTGVPNLVRDYRGFDEPIGKIVFGHDSPEIIVRIAELLQKHPRASEFDFVHSERTLYEILPKGINKGCILPRLCKILDVDEANTVAVGDYNNDIEMVASAALGYAVANATDEVKAVADRITVSNNEHAIAKIIENLANKNCL